MARITWNKATRTYTVSHHTAREHRIVRDIPVKSQAECVKIELHQGWAASFGTEQAERVAAMHVPPRGKPYAITVRA